MLALALLLAADTSTTATASAVAVDAADDGDVGGCRAGRRVRAAASAGGSGCRWTAAGCGSRPRTWSRAGGAPPPPPEPIPQHCRVKLTLKPTSDSNIYSELWMPTDNWNGKLLVVGNGGFAGSIQGYGDMQVALRLGYATAATDTGHNVGRRAERHVRARPSREDRRLRVSSAASRRPSSSKRLIKAMYSRNVQYSYYKGCSTGGRQAIMAATAVPGRLRRHHRRRAGESAHPHAHGRIRAADRAGAQSRHGDFARESADGQRSRDEQVRHAARRLSQQPAAVHVRFLVAALQGRRVERVPDAAAAESGRDVLRRPEEQRKARSSSRGRCSATR